MGVAVMHAFELEDVYLTARLIGNLMYRFDKRHRNRAIEHLRLSFPDWPQERLEQVAKASVRNLVYLGIEVLFTTRMITHARWRNHLVFKNMAGPARMMLERKTGLIMLTGHFGNWEVVGYGLATIGFPQVGVARKLDNPYANEYIMGIREKMGLKIVDKAGATDSVEEVLANKGIVGFIADQDAGRKGAFVDFFGRKASTYKIIGLLAMHYQVPVVIGYGRRLDEQYHFEIGVERTIMPHEWADKPDQLMWITQEYTAALERIVRRDPEQYLWVHRRWKHRPKGEEPTPDGIA
jgi:KDO2-lipid IV(A) lauroyltransferase